MKKILLTTAIALGFGSLSPLVQALQSQSHASPRATVLKIIDCTAATDGAFMLLPGAHIAGGVLTSPVCLAKA